MQALIHAFPFEEVSVFLDREAFLLLPKLPKRN